MSRDKRLGDLSGSTPAWVWPQGLWAASYGPHSEELLYCRLRGAGEPVAGGWAGPVPAVARLEALKVCSPVCALPPLALNPNPSLDIPVHLL